MGAEVTTEPPEGRDVDPDETDRRERLALSDIANTARYWSTKLPDVPLGRFLGGLFQMATAALERRRRGRHPRRPR